MIFILIVVTTVVTAKFPSRLQVLLLHEISILHATHTYLKQFHSWFLLPKDSHHPRSSFTQSVGITVPISDSPVETLQQLITDCGCDYAKQNYNKCTHTHTHTHTPLWSVHTLHHLTGKEIHSPLLTHASLQIIMKTSTPPFLRQRHTTLPTPDHLAKVHPLIKKSMSARQRAAYRLGSDVRFRADLQPDSMEAKTFPILVLSTVP